MTDPRIGPLVLLHLLDTVTFPAELERRGRLPSLGHGYAWEMTGWTVAELAEFFAWLNGEPDLYALPETQRERYRRQLYAADRHWRRDRLALAWLVQAAGRGLTARQALARYHDPEAAANVRAELLALKATAPEPESGGCRGESRSPLGRGSSLPEI